MRDDYIKDGTLMPKSMATDTQCLTYQNLVEAVEGVDLLQLLSLIHISRNAAALTAA